MPVTVSYPGLYVEELPLNAHTIAAAPTSIGAFIGYSHPYKTRLFDVAVRLFGFTDYETHFGGLCTSGLIDPSLGRAVYEFFLNGGSDCWVVGLKPQYYGATGNLLGAPDDATFRFKTSISTAPAGAGIEFLALEPADMVALNVSITNVVPPGDVFDVVVTYGSRVETFRGVKLGGTPEEGPAGRINDKSALVRVQALGGGFGATIGGPAAAALVAPPVPGFVSNTKAGDFIAVFGNDKSLDKVSVFNILATPGNADVSVQSAAMAFAERKRAFYIADPPPNAVADTTSGPFTIELAFANVPRSQNAALYFPYLQSTDPITGAQIESPPSGYVAGIYARTDTRRGVWKAPAGMEATVKDTIGPVPSGLMTDPRHGVLNLASINVLRKFSTGTVVFGARTTVADNNAFAQSKYVPVRRMTLFIEQTLLANLGWVVFEPNDEPLWVAIRSSIENFMLSLFSQGALQGSKPSQAFQVLCDATTTTSDDQQNGIVNIVVAFAPLKPAEFVVIKIAHLAGQAA